MPSVTLNKDVFEQLVGKKLPLEELRDRISYLGTDLEKIEGNEIHVEVFPNRPDMLSEQGFARAFSAFIGQKSGLKNYTVKKSGIAVKVHPNVKHIRPKTACSIVKNLKLTDEKIREIIQIQEKLHITYGRHRRKVAIGIYPFEKIKAPIHYIAKNPHDVVFQPLEFDYALRADEILEQHPAGVAYGHLLEGMDMYTFWIDDAGEVMSLPPIINSHYTGRITEHTKDVFIECSGFDYRVLSICVNILVTALADMGGDIYSVDIKYPDTTYTSPDLRPKKMKFDLAYCNRLLGLALKPAQVQGLFEKMGYGYDKGSVLIPAYRADILHMIDLVEDIAIAYGYENFSAQIPNIGTIGNEDPFYRFRERIATLLTGLGFLEVSTYHLTNQQVHKKMLHEVAMIELAESKSQDYSVLRSWLLPNLMKVLSENTDNAYPQEIFEMGVVFKENPAEEMHVEETFKLAVCISHAKANYTHIKQIFETLASHLELMPELSELAHSSFITGRAASLHIKGKKIGIMGEVHPEVLANWNLNMPVCSLELNLQELYTVFTESRK